MSTWQILSEPFTAINNYKVSFLKDDRECADLGRKLVNGLSIHPELFTRQCVRGDAQIAKIENPQGEAVATSFMRVIDGRLESEFVRGFDSEGKANQDLLSGDAFDAVVNYMMTVNARSPSIKLELDLGENSFSDRVEPVLLAGPATAAVDETRVIQEKRSDGLWARAVNAASNGMSVFRNFLSISSEEKVKATVQPETALVPVQAQAVRIPLVKEDDSFEKISWQAMSEAYTSRNGLVVEPVDSVEGLRLVGERLHNMLMAFPEVYAKSCQAGKMQFAAIYNNERIVGFAELQVGSGMVIPTSSRGYAEGTIDEAVSNAVREYVGMVNARQIQVNVNFGSNSFVTGYEPKDVFTGRFDVAAMVPAGARSMSELAQNVRGYKGFPGGYAEAPQNVIDADFQEVGAGDYYNENYGNDPYPENGENESWPVVTDVFTASNGFVVTALGNDGELAELGASLKNALEFPHTREKWTTECADGDCQVLKVSNTGGETVASADIRVRDGKVYPFLVLGYNNTPVDSTTNLAVTDWCEAVNNKTVVLNFKIEDDRFDLDTPVEETPSAGM